MSTLGLAAAVVSRLPETSSVWLARSVAWVLWHVFGLRRRQVEHGLRRAFPDLTQEQLSQRGKAVMTHLCRVAVETLRFRRYQQQGFDNVSVQGMEHVAQAQAEGKGFLVLSAHLGSWELAVAGAAERYQLPMSLAVKELGAGAEAFVRGQREAAGLQCLNRQALLRTTKRALEGNRGVVFVLDQNATRSIGTFVDFFGHPACTMSVLAVLAKRTGVPVVPAFAVRRPDGQHVLEVGPPIAWESKDGLKDSLHHMTQRYTQIIEDAVRRHPEQWLWTHRRWRTQPPSTQASEGEGV